MDLKSIQKKLHLCANIMQKGFAVEKGLIENVLLVELLQTINSNFRIANPKELFEYKLKSS